MFRRISNKEQFYMTEDVREELKKDSEDATGKQSYASRIE